MACLRFPKYWVHLLLLRRLVLQGRWVRWNMLRKWSSLSECPRHQFCQIKKGQTFARVSLAPVPASCSWNKEKVKERTVVGRKGECLRHGEMRPGEPLGTETVACCGKQPHLKIQSSFPSGGDHLIPGGLHPFILLLTARHFAGPAAPASFPFATSICL